SILRRRIHRGIGAPGLRARLLSGRTRPGPGRRSPESVGVAPPAPRAEELAGPRGRLAMKIATYNVNGVNARLPVLLRWLAEARPDVACLQELKAPQEKFPEDALREAGYHAIWPGQKRWSGVASRAGGPAPAEAARGLPGDPEDAQSRYIEGTVGGVRVGCLYLPNGNPAPGTKFDYKLRWFERLAAHATELVAKAE